MQGRISKPQDQARVTSPQRTGLMQPPWSQAHTPRLNEMPALWRASLRPHPMDSLPIARNAQRVEPGNAAAPAVQRLPMTEAPPPPSQVVVQREILTDEEYDLVKSLFHRLTKRYPPDEYYYIGVGRSPFPLIAFMQAYGVEAGNLPLSGFRPALPGEGLKREHEWESEESLQTGRKSKVMLDAPLSSEVMTTLKAHFDKFIPSARELGEKSLLLIDFSTPGARTILATQAHVDKYLREKYPTTYFCCFPTGMRPPGLEAVALFSDAQAGRMPRDLMRAHDIEPMALDDATTNLIGGERGDELQDSHAQYGKTLLYGDGALSRRDLPKKQTNEEMEETSYGAVLKELQERMKRDEEIQPRLEWKERLEEEVPEMEQDPVARLVMDDSEVELSLLKHI